jgi:hypothetical protein
MRKIDPVEICKVLDILVGETEPIADSAVDAIREENLKTLISVGNWVLWGMMYAAEHRKDLYRSSMDVGERAYAALLEWKDWIAEKEEELA